MPVSPTSTARIPQPGDPDFDWSKYDEWRASTVDPVAAAKATLAKANQFAADNGLTDPVAPSTPTTATRSITRTDPNTGETREWDGSAWVPMIGASDRATDTTPAGVLSRFFGGAASTSPLNPLNLLHAAIHPADTFRAAVVDPVVSLTNAAMKGKEAISGRDIIGQPTSSRLGRRGRRTHGSRWCGAVRRPGRPERGSPNA